MVSSSSSERRLTFFKPMIDNHKQGVRACGTQPPADHAGALPHLSWRQLGEAVEVTVESLIAPPVFDFGMRCRYVYPEPEWSAACGAVRSALWRL